MIAIKRVSIEQQARTIASGYKLVGLYSTILLTLVTIVSMSNVFSSGMFARYSWIPTAWAIVFAMTIDVNIVRLFVEGTVSFCQQKKREGFASYVIGFGLGAVTAAALFIEGLQQSIQLSWNDGLVHTIIVILIGVRVLFVIVLMAREGRNLGLLLYENMCQPEVFNMALDAEVNTVEHVQEHEEQTVQSESSESVQPVSETKHIEPANITQITEHQTRKKQPEKRRKAVRNLEQKVYTIWQSQPNISVRKLAQQLGVSAATVQPLLKQCKEG